MHQKGNKIIYIGNIQEHSWKSEGHYVFEDAFINESDKQLCDSDGNVYNITSFQTVEDHVLANPEGMPYVNGWRFEKRSCVKLDKEAKIGDLLYVKPNLFK